MFIDTHFHASAYVSDSVTMKESLDTLKRDNILIISNSINIETYNLTIELAKEYSYLIPCFGIHPEMAPQFIDKIDFYRNYFEEALIYGEIGLDNHWIKDRNQYPLQEKLFHHFLSYAQKLNKIVILHLDGAK